MSSRLRGGALLLAAIALLLPPTLTAAVHPSPAAAGEQDDDPAAQVVVLVNAERAAGGLPALAINAALRDDAQAYARLMASRGWFSHEGPDGSTMIDRAETAGYGQWRFLGENLARGHPTSGRVVAAWLVSPTHRANLLTVEGGEIGVGYARETDGGQRHFWALVVGSRG